MIVIVEYPTPNGLRYSTAVKEGDIVWSFDCSHLHHSAWTAERCVPKLAKIWTLYEGSEREVIDAETGLIRLTSGSVTRRMRPMKDWKLCGGKIEDSAGWLGDNR